MRAASAGRAVRPYLAVVSPLARRLVARNLQTLEPMLGSAVLAELAVEALDERVLRGLARLVGDVAYAQAMKARLLKSDHASVLTTCG